VSDAAELRSFYALTPDKILSAVERGGRRATGYALSLNSLENRVYELELEDGARIVGKFYRPGRWSEEAIRAEHQFLRELVEAEIPAVAPIVIDGETLFTLPDGIRYALFDKVRGRPTEEPDDERLLMLGRLIGRLHGVGAVTTTSDRARLDPQHYGRNSVASLVDGGHVHPQVTRLYADAASRLLDGIEPIFERLTTTTHRIHADCHHGNLLWDATGPFFLDFDDFTLGPPVQDLWLVAPGRDDEARQQRLLLAEGYAEMRAFDQRSLELVEPLRALRILRYAAWIAARWDDPAFQRAFPDFKDEAFWRREVNVLEDLRHHLQP
jgi:Ser/Thr protein kinase RdoA (MazF antagonist)